MDSPSTPSKVSPHVLTQDELISNKKAAAKSCLTMRSVLDTFVLPGDMSPSVSAQFVTCAVDHASKTETRFQSPARKILYQRHEIIDADTAMPDAKKDQLKNVVSKAYIKAYTGKSSQPSTVTPLANILLNETDEHMNRKLIFDPPKLTATSPGTVSPNSAKEPSRGINKTLWHNVDPYETFDDILLAKSFVEDNFPQFQNTGKRRTQIPHRKRAINKNTKKPGLYTSYRCRLSKSIYGSCRGELFEETGTNSVVLKILTDPTCTCSTSKGLRRGLSSLAKKIVEGVLKESPHGTPKTNSILMLSRMTEENTIDTDSPAARKLLQIQIAHQLKYFAKKERKTSLKQIEKLGSLIAFKKKHTFVVPTPVSADLTEEENLKLFGASLYREENLKPVFSEMVAPLKYKDDAYRSMIVLDGTPDPSDLSRSPAEDRLYNRIEQLQKQSDTPDIPAFAETTVLSSLALLWNVKECKKLGFEVTGSADGAANMVSNDLKFLNFGCFSVNKKGQRLFRPFMYVVCPGESELYFAIGMVTLLKYVRLLFGINKLSFKGLIVSDHAGAFVNVFKLAFPDSDEAQCYPHLLRKFIPGPGTCNASLT